VADPQAAVTDTHAIVFHAAVAASSGRRPRRSTIAASGAMPSCMSRCGHLECSLLARVARINLRRTVRAFFRRSVQQPSYQPLDMTPEQIYLADELRFNRDPFDALICAAARTMELPLITRDGDIRGAGVVKVIW
jgi:PIN domain nuclease of toxin-antitoxin system